MRNISLLNFCNCFQKLLSCSNSLAVVWVKCHSRENWVLLINFINTSALKGNFASGNKQLLDFFPNQKKRARSLLRRSTNSLLKLWRWCFVVLLLLTFRMFGRRWRINLRSRTCPSWCHSGIDPRQKKRTRRSTKDAQDGFLSGVSRSENDFFVSLFHGAGLELYTGHCLPALLCFKSEQ